MVYHPLAFALRAGGHGTAPDDEEVGLLVFVGRLPSLGQVFGLHLERLRLVEAASERLEAYLHCGRTKRRTMFVRLKSAWFSMGHQMRSVFAYSQHWARPKKNSAMNAESGNGCEM